MKKSTSGFTIVELLIVIVVIGILAAIVIVAFNGVNTRATFTKLQSELKSIDKALALYKADNGSYPIPAGGVTWIYSCQAGITNFIPELNSLAPSLPQAPCSTGGTGTSDTWIYRSNGTDYKLLHIRGNASLTSLIPAGLQDQHSRYATDRTWGYWTSGGAGW